MKKNIMLLILVATSLLVSSSGVIFLYLPKEIIESSNNVTYSLEERIEIIDALIGKTSRGDIDKDAIVDILASMKDRELADHNVIVASTDFFRTAIWVIVAAQILHLILLICFFRKLKCA